MRGAAQNRVCNANWGPKQRKSHAPTAVGSTADGTRRSTGDASHGLRTRALDSGAAAWALSLDVQQKCFVETQLSRTCGARIRGRLLCALKAAPSHVRVVCRHCPTAARPRCMRRLCAPPEPGAVEHPRMANVHRLRGFTEDSRIPGLQKAGRVEVRFWQSVHLRASVFRSQPFRQAITNHNSPTRDVLSKAKCLRSPPRRAQARAMAPHAVET